MFDFTWLGDKVPLCPNYPLEWWFPEGRAHEVHETWKLAKSVCDRCEAKEACLRIALKNQERFGVWGGLTPKERTALL
jgi:WhiB family redox-sensing transcriptional regulator